MFLVNINISKLSICYILTFLSLFAASFISVTVGSGQVSLFRIGMTIVFLYLLLKNRMKLVKMSEQTLFMFIWLLYALFSFIWVSDRISWGRAIYFNGMAFAITYIFNYFLNSEDDIIKCCKAFAIGIFFHNIIGWYELITGNYNWASEKLRYAMLISGERFPISVFYNSNNYAFVLIAAIFCILISLDYTNKFKMKLFFITVLVSSLFQLVLTTSRGCLLGLIMGLFIVYILENFDKRRNLLCYIFLTIMVFIALLLPQTNKHINAFFDTYLHFDIGSARSEQTRIMLWMTAFQAFLNTYGFGVGAGNIENQIVHINVFGLEAGSVHNWWLELLATYGVLIFLMYIYYYFNSAVVFFKKIRFNNGNYSRLYICFLGFLIAFIPSSISPSSIFSLESIWCIWALILTLTRIAKEKNTSKEGVD